MTESKAIELLEYIREIGNGEAPYVGCAQNVAIEMAINALKKQIPKKPIFDFNYSDTLSKFHCDCGNIIKVHHDIGTMDNNDAPNYCSNCGIKLDWGSYKE